MLRRFRPLVPRPSCPISRTFPRWFRPTQAARRTHTAFPADDHDGSGTFRSRTERDHHQFWPSHVSGGNLKSGRSPNTSGSRQCRISTECAAQSPLGQISPSRCNRCRNACPIPLSVSACSLLPWSVCICSAASMQYPVSIPAAQWALQTGATSYQYLGETQRWRPGFDGLQVRIIIPAPTKIDVKLMTRVEGRDWPRAFTLVGERDTTIEAIVQEQCSENVRHSVHVPTRRGQRPILLTGCCTGTE